MKYNQLGIQDNC